MRYLLPILLLFTAPLHAEEEVPPPPPLPAEGAVAESADGELQPEVQIRQSADGATVEEYSINGRIYLVKIIPQVGPPYYLIDSDGDGSLETRRSQLDNPETVMWRLLSW